MGVFKKKYGQKDIKKLLEEENIKGLIKAVKDKDEDVRVDAAEALGKIGDQRAVEPLIQALNDKDEYVRIYAATALGKIGDPRAVEPLLQALNDKDDRIPGCATEALGKIGDQRAVEPLIQALERKSTVKKWQIIEALGNLRDERAVIPLIKLIKEEEIYVSNSLIKIGKSTVEPLIEVLKDERAEVRKKAAAILATIGDSRAVDPLIEALNDVDCFVRCTAANCLGILGDKRAAESLVQALKDIPYEAKQALERLGESAAEALNQAVENENQNIRSAVKHILVKLEEAKVVRQIVTTQESTATPKASEADASESRPSDDEPIRKKPELQYGFFYYNIDTLDKFLDDARVKLENFPLKSEEEIEGLFKSFAPYTDLSKPIRSNSLEEILKNLKSWIKKNSKRSDFESGPQIDILEGGTGRIRFVTAHKGVPMGVFKTFSAYQCEKVWVFWYN